MLSDALPLAERIKSRTGQTVTPEAVLAVADALRQEPSLAARLIAVAEAEFGATYEEGDYSLLALPTNIGESDHQSSVNHSTPK